MALSFGLQTAGALSEANLGSTFRLLDVKVECADSQINMGPARMNGT